MTDRFAHFLQRVEERYGLHLTLEDLKEIAESIKSGKAKLVRAEAASVRYKVRWHGIMLVVVLNRAHSVFITALPLNETTSKSSFNGKILRYKDALYINWLYNSLFEKDKNKKAICQRCKSHNIKADLARDRFYCADCNWVTKFKEPTITQCALNVLTRQGTFERAYHLSQNLWWYLHRKNKSIEVDDFKLSAILEDDDKLRYKILYKDGIRIVPLGLYTKEKLRRK